MIETVAFSAESVRILCEEIRLLDMKKIFVLLGCLFVFTACNPGDPFAPLPQEPRETLVGEILPFDLSVVTRATHRLERDEKLVVLLASDIVPLEEFEGQEVSVTGVRKAEEMRELFIVDEVHLLSEELIHDLAAELPARFVAKNFSFVFPATWQYSTSPDGTMHFTEKTDKQGRVFLQFSVTPMESRDKRLTPTASIGPFKGTKNIMADQLGIEQQKIVLWSNNTDNKYTFSFTTNYEEFEKKNAFFRLLNSFIEGEENVRAAVEEDRRLQAEREAEKVRLLTKKEEPLVEEAEDEVLEDTGEEEGEGFFSRLFGGSEDVDTEEALQRAAESAADTPLNKNYTNLIDEKAFPYSSSYLNFSMRAPWGYWFKNVGPTDPLLLQFGFAKHEIKGMADSDFFLEIVPSERPVTIPRERMDGDMLIIEWPRDESSYFRFRGPESARDAMMSIQATVKNL